MIGGLVTSFILKLLVYPPVYVIWKWRFEMNRGAVDVSQLPIPEIRGHGGWRTGKTRDIRHAIDGVPRESFGLCCGELDFEFVESAFGI
jgi:hypothetical protein